MFYFLTILIFLHQFFNIKIRGRLLLRQLLSINPVEACKGDTIKFEYIGFYPVTITVEDPSSPLEIIMEEDRATLMGEVVYLDSSDTPKMSKGILDIIVVDEKGRHISPLDVKVYKVDPDKDGDKNEYRLESIVTDTNNLRLFWVWNWMLQDKDGRPLKEVTLRIEAEGYEPATVKVKYPKRTTKKTIKLKRTRK